MLNAKGNPDDRHETGQRAAEVTQGQPPVGYEKPDHVSHHSQWARSKVTFSPQLTTVDGSRTKRPEGEATDHPARPCPRQSNYRDRADQRCQPSGKSHGQSTEENPEQIERHRDHVSIVTAHPFRVR